MKVCRMTVIDIVGRKFGGHLNKLKKHHIDFIYIGVNSYQLVVSRTKRGLRRKGFKYIEKKRIFYKLLSRCNEPIPSFDEILEANRDVLERIKEKGD